MFSDELNAKCYLKAQSWTVYSVVDGESMLPCYAVLVIDCL